MLSRVVVVVATVLFNWMPGLLAESPVVLGAAQGYVSLIRVIANPAQFDGQRMKVVGYLGRNGLDRSMGVYVSEVDSLNYVPCNSVDLNLKSSVEKTAETLIRQYVVFSAVYHAPPPRAENNGHFDQISDLQPWNAGDHAVQREHP
jgi:hypothetical protein